MENAVKYWPQITVIVITCISIINEMYNNKHSVYYKSPNILHISVNILNIVSLFFGGFFRVSFPFFIWLALFTTGVGVMLTRVGEPRRKSSIFSLILASLVGHAIYYWGGFYDGFR